MSSHFARAAVVAGTALGVLSGGAGVAFAAAPLTTNPTACHEGAHDYPECGKDHPKKPHKHPKPHKHHDPDDKPKTAKSHKKTVHATEVSAILSGGTGTAGSGLIGVGSSSSTTPTSYELGAGGLALVALGGGAFVAVGARRRRSSGGSHSN